MASHNKGVVEGIGINDALYKVKIIVDDKLEWICPYYRVWQSMLTRCYNAKSQNRSSGSVYIDCSVCDEWHLFSNFKSWMEQQDWEGKQLDKDLLKGDANLYSPETCCFIPRSINIFLTVNKNKKTNFPIGVTLKDNINKRRKIYSAKIACMKKNKSLGVYMTPMEAHIAWQKYKLKQTLTLINSDFSSKILKGLCRVYLKLQDEIRNQKETKSL